MLDDPFTRARTAALMIALVAALSFWPVSAEIASAEGPDDANLTTRFNYVSQHGNVHCSVQCENSLNMMHSHAKMEGSCCAPTDEARYRQQLDGLKKYSDVA